MKCFATSLGEQLVRSQFIVYYYIVFYFCAQSSCVDVCLTYYSESVEVPQVNWWIKRGEKCFFSPRINLDALKINLCECHEG